MQNGSISCIALPESLPGGVRAVLAENLLASMLGLEVASGNDALASHSAIRKTAKLMLQFIPGTDFIFSGYSAVPKRDNLFGGGNFDAEDFDDYNVLQRDMQVDGGRAPGHRGRGAGRSGAKRPQAIQAVYAELGFPADHRRGGGSRRTSATAATTCRSAIWSPIWPLPTAFWPAIRTCSPWWKRCNSAASPRRRATSWRWVASALPAIICSRRRSSTNDFHVLSAINDVNDYTGPGTGYRLDGERWEEIQHIPQAKSPRDFIADQIGEPLPQAGRGRPGQTGHAPGGDRRGRPGLWHGD